MNLDNDYDNDGNNIVPCPICGNVYCPSNSNPDEQCPEEEQYAEYMEFESQLAQAILGGLEHRGFYDCGKYLDQTLIENIRPLFNKQLQKSKADWLRSEIEKLEGSIKTGNNGEGLPFENSPDIYGNARMEAWKNGYNKSLTSIITRYKEELLELEKWE